MTDLPFKDVKIGDRIHFLGNLIGFTPEEYEKRLIVYTRTPDRLLPNVFGLEVSTLEYTDSKGNVIAAFCPPDSTTIVRLLD